MQANSPLLLLFVGVLIGIALTIFIIRSSYQGRRREGRSYSNSKGYRKYSNNSYPRGEHRNLWTFLFVMSLFAFAMFHSKGKSEEPEYERPPVPSEQLPVKEEDKKRELLRPSSVAEDLFSDEPKAEQPDDFPQKVFVKRTGEDTIQRSEPEEKQIDQENLAVDPPAVFHKENILYNSSPENEMQESFFYIQVEAASKEVKIFKLADNWRENSPFRAHVGYGADQTLPFKLLIGPYRTKDMARKQLRKVGKKGAFIRNIQKDGIQLIDRND